MAKLKDVTLILGEGITEFYYLNSLKDRDPSLQNIEPKIPKHSSIKDLEKRIEAAIKEGYTRIFCIIDMDNKREGKEKSNYEKLKNKHCSDKKSKRQVCEVIFFETDPCIELFFLYYFTLVTKPFPQSIDVVKELQSYCASYGKHKKFFVSNPLHSYFEKNNGTLEKTCKNAKSSCSLIPRNSYSELGKMFDKLKLL